MTRPIPTRPRGLTAVEVLFVLAVLVVYLLILLPALARLRTDARLMRCMAQQRTIANGVLTYSSIYNGFPESVAQNPGRSRWVNPDRLNYRAGASDAPGGRDRADRGRVGIMLGELLPDGDVFIDPLGPGRPDDFDSLYKTPGETKALASSYQLMWNYAGWETIDTGATITGPKGPTGAETASDLLTADVFYRVDLMGVDSHGQPLPQWQFNHPIWEGQSFPRSLQYQRYAATGPMPRFTPGQETLAICGSFADGHVSRRSPDNAFEVRLSSNRGVRAWLPVDQP